VFNVLFSDTTSNLRRAGSTTTHHTLTHEEPVDAARDADARAIANYLKGLPASSQSTGRRADRQQLDAGETSYFPAQKSHLRPR
jgi:hypothetical protein